MAGLVINPSGTYTDYFIVSFDGGPYVMPQSGADLALRLRGRVPGRYGAGGMDVSLPQGADEAGTVIVHRFHPWEDRMGGCGILQFEGWVEHPKAALQAKGARSFDSLEMPVGIIAMLGYEGLSPRIGAS